MSSTRSRVLALAVLTVAVAGSGIVALGTVCDFDPACGEPVDRSVRLSHAGADEGVLSYEATLVDGAVVDDAVAWTRTPASPTDGGNGTGPTVILAVHKNDIPLEPGIRHHLPGGNGTLAWDSGSYDTETVPGDDFRFTLYLETETDEVTLQRTQVTITR